MSKRPLKFKDFVMVDYTQTGDGQRMKNAKKRKKDSGEGTTEALDLAARRARARNLKKNKAKIAMGRKRAARKVANMDTLKTRARKQARTLVLKKITKGVPKQELSFARRQSIEKRLDKMSPRIDKIARKILPNVRRQELERKRNKNKANTSEPSKA